MFSSLSDLILRQVFLFLFSYNATLDLPQGICHLAAAAASKSLQSDSVRPHRWQPTRRPRPWDSPGKSTGVGCHCLLQWVTVKSESEVAQSRPTLRDPMDCSPPGSSVRGVFQARALEWGAIAWQLIFHVSAFRTDCELPTERGQCMEATSPQNSMLLPLLPLSFWLICWLRGVTREGAITSALQHFTRAFSHVISAGGKLSVCIPCFIILCA